LQRAPEAPRDLRDRALRLAAEILELGNASPPGTGLGLASKILEDGRAWRKFQAICEAQGGMHRPPVAAYTHVITAAAPGTVILIDNRKLARIAKLAGAPASRAAGLELHAPVGTRVERGQPLFTVYAQAPGELAYALQYVASQPDIVRIGEDS
jgi:thymidine phosphorylase